MKRRMWSLAFGLVCTGMALSVSGHAGWAPQKAQAVASMSALELPGLKKPTTKRFVNAKLSDVLAWLSLEQFSFVADAGEFPNQGQVTLSFKAQPLGAVLDAIADAFNGRWERRGDIFTLRPAGSRNVFEMPGAPAVATTVEPSVFRGTGRAVPGSTSHLPSTIRGALAAPKIEGVPMLPSTTVRGAQGTVIAPRTFSTTPLPLSTIRSALTAPRVEGTPSPLISPSFVTTPRTALPPSAIRDLNLKTFSGPTTLMPLRSALVGAQDPKSHEEAMRAAEKAMRAAEEHIRKMHESGEWTKHMERAMQEAHGSEAHRKAMEEALRAMRDFHNSPEWKKAWEQAREEMRKALQSGKVKEGGKERAMTDKERAALEKSLEQLKDFKGPDIKFDSKMFQTIPKMEKFTFVAPKEFDKKHFEEMMKNMPKFEGKFFTPEFQQLDSERSRKIQEKIQEMRKKSGTPPTFEMMSPDVFNRMRFQGLEKMKLEGLEKMRFEGLDKMKIEGLEKMKFEELKGLQGVKPFGLDSKKMRIVDLIDSLSAAQKEKHEKQGYLTLEDLNPKQREMLGSVPSEGNWTFSYSVEGKKLTIKNK